MNGVRGFRSIQQDGRGGGVKGSIVFLFVALFSGVSVIRRRVLQNLLGMNVGIFSNVVDGVGGQADDRWLRRARRLKATRTMFTASAGTEFRLSNSTLRGGIVFKFASMPPRESMDVEHAGVQRLNDSLLRGRRHYVAASRSLWGIVHTECGVEMGVRLTQSEY